MQRRWKLLIILFSFLFLSQSLLKAEETVFKGDLWNLLNYIRINNALKKYVQIQEEGGWPVLPANIILKKDDSSEHVLTLRKRLEITGDLTSDKRENLYFFDKELEEAVKKFQYRHGLIMDGIVGPETLAALNISVEERVKELRLNQERIFNLFDDYIERFILVNIPAYELKIIEKGREVLQMKAIVGHIGSKTPVFQDEIEYIVFNPTWRIPINKTVRDIIPIIKSDPTYLERKNIRVFDGWGADAKELKPDEIDWDYYNLNNFDLMLEQQAGPQNELGRFKFMFPNQYLVYIHDTPARELFAYNERAFSSGCIRVEKPLDLALYCLKDQADWDLNRIMEVIAQGEPEEVYLEETIPVVIVYWTAWVDGSGLVHFRKDIYNHN